MMLPVLPRYVFLVAVHLISYIPPLLDQPLIRLDKGWGVWLVLT